MLKPLCVVIGTTGAGKSDLAVQLAKRFGSQVINADSMQIYRGFDTITNKITVEEQENVPHRLMSFLNFDKEYSVPEFERDASRVIDEIHSQGKIPIVVGGTHYYLQSLLFEDTTLSAIDKLTNDSSPSKPPHPDSHILDDDPSAMLSYLKKVDPVMAEQWHPRDTRKIRRSLEIYFHTGRPPSEIYSEQKMKSSGSKLRYKSLIFWAFADSLVLMPRLDKRVDKMLSHGLVDEIKSMKSLAESEKFSPDFTRGIWQCIGFKEFMPWFEAPSDIVFNDCLERMKVSTRQYAKSQKKWIQSRFLPMCLAQQDLSPSSILFSTTNTTDLNNWGEQVEKACRVFQYFFYNGDAIAPSADDQHAFEKARDYLSIMNGRQSQKKKFVCEECLDKRGDPFTVIGEDAFNVHIKSRKHKTTVRRKKERAERQIRLKNIGILK
ncbi:tRNA dimethylallyltransferase [Schizosaccharomyces pombe]